MNCWQILEINPTDNAREIKRAYANKSKLVHPEEHPEEFRELHDAYELALKICKEMSESDDDYSEHAQNPEQPRRILRKKDADDGLESSKAIDDVINSEYEVEDNQASDDETDLFDVLEGYRFKQTAKRKRESVNTVEEDSGNLLEDDLGFDEAIQRAYQNYKEQIILNTQRVMGKLEVLSYMLPDKTKSEWQKVMQGNDFLEAMDSEYFAYQLTGFTKDHEDLPKEYYKSLVKILNFDELATREEKGFYTELFNLCVKRGAYEYAPITKKGLALDGFIVAFMLLLSSSVRIIKHLDIVNSENVIYLAVVVVSLTLIGIAISRREKLKVIFGKVNRKYLIGKFFYPIKPKYALENRIKPTWIHYVLDVLIFFGATYLFAEIDNFGISLLFMFMAIWFFATFVYMVIMHIIVGILCLKDRKKK